MPPASGARGSLVAALLAAPGAWAAGTSDPADPAGRAAAWAAAELGLPGPDVLPELRFIPRAELAHRQFGPAATSDHARHVLALYDRGHGILYLPEGWTGETPAEMSVLVHELVHHIQAVEGEEFPCMAARERDAYAVQAPWLEAEGEDPFATFNLNALALMLLTTCPPPR